MKNKKIVIFISVIFMMVLVLFFTTNKLEKKDLTNDGYQKTTILKSDEVFTNILVKFNDNLYGKSFGVIDYDKNAVGIKHADEFFNVSTIDVERVEKVAREFNPCGIMTLATDMPMRSVAKASESCGLPGITMETAIKSTDKGEMIKAFEKNGVAHPWFFIAENKEEFDSLKEKVSYPCIMKPTDSSGSRGVVLIENSGKLEEEYYYTREKTEDGYTPWEHQRTRDYTLKTETASIVVYTRPGVFSEFDGSKDQLINAVITSTSAANWNTHCGKYLSWKNQASKYGTVTIAFPAG